MIGINHGWVMNVLYVIYVAVSIFIGMVILNLIPFPRTPIMILLLFVMLVGAMEWRVQNNRHAM
uniref:Putative ovule protein n=1 Tax=Solanum chacoense TaxID=4108 RepID=A0A0V0HQH5_SOLCH